MTINKALGVLLSLTLLFGLSACGGGGGGSSCNSSCTVGGSVSGLTLGFLMLQINNDKVIAIYPGQTSFVMSPFFSEGNVYVVSVFSQPMISTWNGSQYVVSTQTCSVLNSTGTIVDKNVMNVSVTCN